MAKKKTTFDYMREIRGSWAINPRTRVQENNLKNKKKRRQDEKKIEKGTYFGEDDPNNRDVSLY